MTNEKWPHVVVQQSTARYEVWEPCIEHCITYHSCIAVCNSRFDAERIAKALDAKS